jgi:hypothetical protein
MSLRFISVVWLRAKRMMRDYSMVTLSVILRAIVYCVCARGQTNM